MSWLRLDDNFLDHPKLADLDDRSIVVWLKALAHCRKHPSTNGFISNRVLAKFKVSKKTRAALVQPPAGYESGLWREAVDQESGASQGVLIHDYADYQPTPDKQVQSEKSRAGGVASGKIRQAKSSESQSSLNLSGSEDRTSVVPEAPEQIEPRARVPTQPNPTQPNPTRLSEPEQPAVAAVVTPSEPEPKPKTDHQLLMDHYFEVFTKALGTKPMINGADGTKASVILKAFGLEQSKEIVNLWLADPRNLDKWSSLRFIDPNQVAKAMSDKKNPKKGFNPAITTPDVPRFDLLESSTESRPGIAHLKAAQPIGPDQDDFRDEERIAK